MTVTCYRNEYRMRDGSRRIGLPHFTRDGAVRAGAEVQGTAGALALFRWRIATSTPLVNPYLTDDCRLRIAAAAVPSPGQDALA